MNSDFRTVSDRRPGLTPPQFSMKVLLLLIAFFGGVLAIAPYLGPVGMFVMVITLLSIFAHVASTAIGGQLRRNGARAAHASENEQHREPVVIRPVRARQSDFAPTTQLSRHAPLDRGPIYAGTAAGVVLGMLLGGGTLTALMWQDFSLVNVLFGACCSGVLGGFFGFWASSLFQVAKSAWAEARRDTRP